MLSKAAIRSDAICSCNLLYDDLFVNSGECICDKGAVPGAEALIEANLGDIKCICACQGPNAVDVRVEKAESPESYAAASRDLGC
jgi:hypothetical protein